MRIPKLLLLILLSITHLLSMGCNGNTESKSSSESKQDQQAPPQYQEGGINNSDSKTPESETQNDPTQRNSKRKSKKGIAYQQGDNSTPPNVSNTIPPKVFKVLQYIKANNEAPDGYVGGRVFQNREGILDKRDASGKKIAYQEWDVNPKKNGVNRGTERLITGSDNRAWYTNDHYKSFKEVK